MEIEKGRIPCRCPEDRLSGVSGAATAATETRLSKKRTRLCPRTRRRMQIIIRREIKGPERTGRSRNPENRVNSRKYNRDENVSRRCRAPASSRRDPSLALTPCSLLPVPFLPPSSLPLHPFLLLSRCTHVQALPASPWISFLPNRH